MKNSKLFANISSNSSTNNKRPKSGSPSKRNVRRGSKSPNREFIPKPNIHDSFQRMYFRDTYQTTEGSEALMFKNAWTILNSVREGTVRASSLSGKATTKTPTQNFSAQIQPGPKYSAKTSKKPVPKRSDEQLKNVAVSLSPSKSLPDQKIKGILSKARAQPNIQPELAKTSKIEKKSREKPKIPDLSSKHKTKVSTKPETNLSSLPEDIPFTLRSFVKEDNNNNNFPENPDKPRDQNGITVDDLRGSSSPLPNNVATANLGECESNTNDQRENVNINLTLSLSQLGNGGYLYPNKLEEDSPDKPIRTLRLTRSRTRLNSNKSETSIQTDLFPDHLKDIGGGEAGSSSSVEEVVTELFPKDFDNGSTSSFPSAVPSSQNWRKRQPKPVDLTLPKENLSDYVQLHLPTVISYTGDSVKSLLTAADNIIKTCIIPPDDNPMTEEEMDQDENTVVISLLRLIGVPKQLRHNIYKESLYNLEALQEVSIGSIDVLNNVIDWIINGNCGGREEILHKVRVIASITTDFNPGSDIWQQFEKDLSVFSAEVCETMKDGITVAGKCSGTAINSLNGQIDTAATKIAKSLSNLCLSLAGPDEESLVEVGDQNSFMRNVISKLNEQIETAATKIAKSISNMYLNFSAPVVEKEDLRLSLPGPDEENQNLSLRLSSPDEENPDSGLSISGPDQKMADLGLSLSGPLEEKADLDFGLSGPDEENSDLGLRLSASVKEKAVLDFSLSGSQEEKSDLDLSFSGADEEETDLGLSLSEANGENPDSGLSLSGADEQKVDLDLSLSQPEEAQPDEAVEQNPSMNKASRTLNKQIDTKENPTNTVEEAKLQEDLNELEHIVHQLCNEVIKGSCNTIEKEPLEPEQIIFNFMTPSTSSNLPVFPQIISKGSTQSKLMKMDNSAAPMHLTSDITPSKFPVSRSSKIPVRVTAVNTKPLTTKDVEVKVPKQSSTISLYPPKPIRKDQESNYINATVFQPLPGSYSIPTKPTFQPTKPSPTFQPLTKPLPSFQPIKPLPSFSYQERDVNLSKASSKLKLITTVPFQRANTDSYASTTPVKYAGQVKRETVAPPLRTSSRASLVRTSSYLELYQKKQTLGVSTPNRLDRQPGYAPSSSNIRTHSAGPNLRRGNTALPCASSYRPEANRGFNHPSVRISNSSLHFANGTRAEANPGTASPSLRISNTSRTNLVRTNSYRELHFAHGIRAEANPGSAGSSLRMSNISPASLVRSNSYRELHFPHVIRAEVNHGYASPQLEMNQNQIGANSSLVSHLAGQLIGPWMDIMGESSRSNNPNTTQTAPQNNEFTMIDPSEFLSSVKRKQQK